jgi:hypothetical protein
MQVGHSLRRNEPLNVDSCTVIVAHPKLPSGEDHPPAQRFVMPVGYISKRGTVTDPSNTGRLTAKTSEAPLSRNHPLDHQVSPQPPKKSSLIKHYTLEEDPVPAEDSVMAPEEQTGVLDVQPTTTALRKRQSQQTSKIESQTWPFQTRTET